MYMNRKDFNNLQTLPRRENTLILQQILETTFIMKCTEISKENFIVDIGLKGLRSVLKEDSWESGVTLVRSALMSRNGSPILTSNTKFPFKSKPLLPISNNKVRLSLFLA